MCPFASTVELELLRENEARRAKTSLGDSAANGTSRGVSKEACLLE